MRAYTLYFLAGTSCLLAAVGLLFWWLSWDGITRYSLPPLWLVASIGVLIASGLACAIVPWYFNALKYPDEEEETEENKLVQFYDYLMTRAPDLKLEFINMEIERKFIEIFPEVLKERAAPGERLLASNNTEKSKEPKT